MDANRATITLHRAGIGINRYTIGTNRWVIALNRRAIASGGGTIGINHRTIEYKRATIDARRTALTRGHFSVEPDPAPVASYLVMDADAFIAYALDPARTLEERITTEVLVELGVGWWHARRKEYVGGTLDERMAIDRERKLNPAYEPRYSEVSVRKAAETLVDLKDLHGHQGRPLRSLEPFRFCTALQTLNLRGDNPADLSPLADLPALHTLTLGPPYAPTLDPACEDFTPLARCRALRTLNLSFAAHWPDLTGLDTLPELTALSLGGNLLAMPRGAVFPRVLRATIHCQPLAMRNVADLPGLPACEFLSVQGVERLDGIETMPRLRNLTVRGRFQTLEPLAALRELTWLWVITEASYAGGSPPREIAPVARLPKLQCFRIGPPITLLDTPRDYSPLAEAPALRELSVEGCPPVEMEVAAIRAGLPPWDDVFLLPEPRPVPPLRLIVADHGKEPMSPDVRLEPDEAAPADTGLRECEGRWMKKYLADAISRRIGYEEWGETSAAGMSRWLQVNVESFDVVYRLPEIVDATRAVLASLRGTYLARLMIALRAKPPAATPAQKELEAQFREQQDEADYQQRQRDAEAYQERLHQMELKKQQGEPIEAENFSPEERAPYPVPPWEAGEDEEEEGEIDFSGEGDGEGGTVVKEKPDPPPAFLDDEHPLAGNYRLMACITLEEMWLLTHHRGIGEHLMGREADVVIAPEKPDGA